MLTLDEFIKKGLERAPVPTNAYVKEKGFKFLYVRIGRRLLGGQMVTPTLDLANLEASRPGKGTFTKLVERLKAEHPELTLVVECVLNPRFVEKLERMGFKHKEQNPQESPTLWLPHKEHAQ